MIHLKTVTLCGSPLNLEFKERYYQFSIIWKLLLLSTGIAIYMWVDFTRCGSYWRRRGQISAFNYCKNLYRLLQCLPCIKQNIYECIGLNCEWWNQTQAVNTMSSALILSMNITTIFGEQSALGHLRQMRGWFLPRVTPLIWLKYIIPSELSVCCRNSDYDWCNIKFSWKSWWWSW